MLLVTGILILLLVIFAPQWWTRYVFRRYSVELNSLPGTGGELAEHLLNRFNMPDTSVERIETDEDHYEPESRTVRLSSSNYDKKSLTAVVVAAHEVGHAIQHQQGYGPLNLRWRLAWYVRLSEKIASMLLVAFPFIAMLTKMPVVGGFLLLCGLFILFLPVIFHLVTLPVEFDASFNRALPILEHGEYLPDSAIPIARKILLAAALTYVAASLASILNFYRWLVFLRR